MVRVPNARSLSVLLGQELGDQPEPSAFAQMTPKEIDRFLISCRRAIHGHRRDSWSRDVETAETALIAIEAIQNVLKELLEVAPPAKVAKIEALLEK